MPYKVRCNVFLPLKTIPFNFTVNTKRDYIRLVEFIRNSKHIDFVAAYPIIATDTFHSAVHLMSNTSEDVKIEYLAYMKSQLKKRRKDVS